MTTMTDYLETYLQDHRAGAEAGSDLAQRLLEENRGTQYEDFLARLAEQIEQDVEALEQIMDRFGVDRSFMKTAAAQIGEKVARLKPNDQLTGYSPLSRVLEFEGLRAGVQGKLSLWDSLLEIEPFDDASTPTSSPSFSPAPSPSSTACASTTGSPRARRSRRSRRVWRNAAGQ